MLSSRARDLLGTTTPSLAPAADVPELFEAAPGGQQLPGRAVLDDAALVEHHDAVEIGDGLEPVRDRDDRVLAELVPDQALHERVGLVVDAAEEEETSRLALCALGMGGVSRPRSDRKMGEGRRGEGDKIPAGGFVEEHHAADVLAEDRAREGEELPLAVAEDVIAEGGVEAALLLDRRPETDLLEHGGDRVGGYGGAVRVEVVADAAGEGEVILGDGDQARTHLLAPDGGNVDVVDGDATGGEVEEPDEGEEEGRLSTVGRDAMLAFLQPWSTCPRFSVDGDTYLPVRPQMPIVSPGAKEREMPSRAWMTAPSVLPPVTVWPFGS